MAGAALRDGLLGCESLSEFNFAKPALRKAGFQDLAGRPSHYGICFLSSE
jgi:hypothetical protein